MTEEQEVVKIEPYQSSEQFNGDQITLNSILNACDHAFTMALLDHLTLHIKNQLRGATTQLISREEIKQLLSLHFGDPCDLTTLNQDLQRLQQFLQDSPL